ncbi:MAG: ABC transporter permease [Dermatophilaceae bacterium]
MNTSTGPSLRRLDAGDVRDAGASSQDVPGARRQGAAPGGKVGRAGVPLARLFRVELRKLLDTRAGRWLAGVTALIAVLVVAAVLIWGESSDLAFAELIPLAMLPLGSLLPVLGILTATAEWSQRTGMVTFVLEPHRGRVVAAKVAAAAVLGLGVVGTAFAGAAVLYLGVVVTRGLAADWSVPGDVVGGVALAMVVVLVQGVAFGLLFLNTPLAIVVSLVLPTAFSLIGGLASGFAEVARWLDLSTVIEPLLAGAMTSADWAHLGTASVVWVGLPLGVGTWRVLTAEIA